MTREEFIKSLLDDKNNWSVGEDDPYQFQQPGNKLLKLTIDSYIVTTTIRPGDDVESLIGRYKSIFSNEVRQIRGFDEKIDKLYQEYIASNRDSNLGEILST